MTIMKAAVSFVMTVYNGAAYLEETLRGLLAVDWLDYEIVIVNDGSTDSSAEVIRALTKNSSRIRFHDRGRLGRGRALNVGVAIASAEFIAINDADDYSLPNRLRTTVPVLQRDGSLSFAAGSHKVVPEAMWSTEVDPELPSFCRYRPIPCYELYRRNHLVHSALTFRKSVWKEVGGYNEELSSHIDYEFYFRLLGDGPGSHTDDVVVLHRRRLNTSFKQTSAREYLANYKAALRTARERCSVPLNCRMYDFKPYLMAAHHAWKKRWRQQL